MSLGKIPLQREIVRGRVRRELCSRRIPFAPRDHADAGTSTGSVTARQDASRLAGAGPAQTGGLGDTGG